MTGVSQWPIFQSDFLNAIVASVRKRSKSIKHKVRKYSFTKVIEKNGSEEIEKLEIQFILPVNNATIRIYLWEDRWMWIDIRESSKQGWMFDWSKEGRIGGKNSIDIRQAIESTITLSSSLRDGRSRDFEACWSQIALGGPKK
jgi:hypothetical protein